MRRFRLNGRRTAVAAAVAAACSTLVPAARAVDYTWSSTTSGATWTNGDNWTTAGADDATFPDGFDDNATFNVAPAGTTDFIVDLTTNLDVGNITFNSASTARYQIGSTNATAPTLRVNRIDQTAADDNRVAATVVLASNGAADLTLNNTVTTDDLGVQGRIVAGGNVVKVGAGLLRVGTSGFAITDSSVAGQWQLNAGTLRAATGGTVAGANPLAGAPVVFSSAGGQTLSLTTNDVNFDFVSNVTMNGSGTISADRAGSAGSGKTSTIGTITLADGVTLMTASGNSYLLAADGIVLGGPTATVNAGAQLTTGPVTGTGNNLVKAGASVLVLAGDSTHNDTTVTVGTLRVSADSGLGNGTTTVNRAAWLDFATVDQSASQTVVVNEGGAIAGRNLANQTFGSTPAAGVVVLSPNAIIVDETTNASPTNLPAAAQQGNTLYRGLRSNTVNVTDVGATAGVFRGVAFGVFTSTAADYSGDLTAAAGQDLRIYLATSKAFGPTSATAIANSAGIPTLNTDTGIVEVTGPGTLTLNSRIANPSTDGNYTTINRVGEAGLQNNDLLAFDTNGGATGNAGKSLPAGKTVNVTNGRVRLFDATDVVDATAVVNLNAGATLLLGDQSPSSGTFNLNAGGGATISAANRLTNGATFTAQVGSFVALTNDITFAGATGIPTTADILLNEDDHDVFGNPTFTLGEGRRFATPSGNDGNYDVLAGTGVTTAKIQPAAPATPGATPTLGFSAAPGKTLNVDVPVTVNDLGDADPSNDVRADVFIGDPGTYTTIVGSNSTTTPNVTRSTVAQTGTVRLASVTARNVTVHSGQFQLDDGTLTDISGDIDVRTGANFFANDDANNLVTASLQDGGVARGPNGVLVRNGAFAELEYKALPSTANAGLITQRLTFEGMNGNAINLTVDRTAAAGPAAVHLTDVRLADGAVLGINEEDTDAPVVRVSVNLLGPSATITDEANADDIDLGNVSGGNGRVLTLGRLASNENTTTSATLFGTLAANTTINLAYAAVTGGQTEGRLVLTDASAVDAAARIRLSGVSTREAIELSGPVVTVAGTLEAATGGQIDMTSDAAGSSASEFRVGTFDLRGGSTVSLNQQGAAAFVVTSRLKGAGTLTGGNLSIAAAATLAPGDDAPGKLTIAGNLAVGDDAVYEYEIGATPATSDLIDLTGTTRTVSFGADLVLTITNPTGADLTGQKYVLFNYTGADPAALPNITFTNLAGNVSFDPGQSQIVLTNVVPEPGTTSLLAAVGLGLLARRRRRA